MILPIVQIVYWLGLAAWFGAALFSAIASPIILKTVRDGNPILPDVLSVNMEGQHGTLLAGTIISNILSALFPVQMLCAGLMAAALIAYLFVANFSDSASFGPLFVRIGLLVIAVSVVIYDRKVLWPKILHQRKQYIDHADEPDVADPAREELGLRQKESLVLLQILLFLLTGLVMYSAAAVPTVIRVGPSPVGEHAAPGQSQ